MTIDSARLHMGLPASVSVRTSPISGTMHALGSTTSGRGGRRPALVGTRRASIGSGWTIVRLIEPRGGPPPRVLELDARSHVVVPVRVAPRSTVDGKSSRCRGSGPKHDGPATPHLGEPGSLDAPSCRRFHLSRANGLPPPAGVGHRLELDRVSSSIIQRRWALARAGRGSVGGRRSIPLMNAIPATDRRRTVVARARRLVRRLLRTDLDEVRSRSCTQASASRALSTDRESHAVARKSE